MVMRRILMVTIVLMPSGVLGSPEQKQGQPTAESAAARPLPGESRSSLPSPQPTDLASAVRQVSAQTRALVLLDTRLFKLISPDLSSYTKAASFRRGFCITVLPIVDLDDYRPPEIRRAIQGWYAAKPGLEGILFVGNVKLPSFFMPRADTPSTRLWPRYYEDIDMAAQRRIPPGTVLKECGPVNPWPCVAGMKQFKVPEHDFDDLAQGPSKGPNSGSVLAGRLPRRHEEQLSGLGQSIEAVFQESPCVL